MRRVTPNAAAIPTNRAPPAKGPSGHIDARCANPVRRVLNPKTARSLYDVLFIQKKMSSIDRSARKRPCMILSGIGQKTRHRPIMRETSRHRFVRLRRRSLQPLDSPHYPRKERLDQIERAPGKSQRQFIWNGGNYTAMAVCAGGGHAPVGGRSDSGG